MWLFLLSSCPAVFPCAAVGLSTVSYSNDNSHMDKSVTRAIMYTVIVADSACIHTSRDGAQVAARYMLSALLFLYCCVCVCVLLL